MPVIHVHPTAEQPLEQLAFAPVEMVIIAQTLILLMLPAQVSNFSSVKMLFGIVIRSNISFAFRSNEDCSQPRDAWRCS